MRFIDEARIYLKSGDGGNGCVSFRREKFVEAGGPDGGDGGRGGSIIIETDSHINTLSDFRYKREYKAQNGESGKGRNCTGASRPPITLRIPVGTQVLDEDDNLLYDFTEEGQSQEILKGGKGGLGNTHFKSSITQAPRRTTSGEQGQEMWVLLKLKLLSDAGLVGLPNTGKSTFLSSVTNAKPKIADYPFTTLSPGLGIVRLEDEEFVLADIPGLIEGAHEGLGLGDKFLKHVERCGVLLHLIDGTAEDVVQNYGIVRGELEAYSELLCDKTEIVALNKCDSLTEEEIELKARPLEEASGGKIYVISGATGKGIQEVLWLLLEEIKAFKANQ